MSEIHQLKKKMVRGAVSDNVDLILGRYPQAEQHTAAPTNPKLMVLVAILASLLCLPFFAVAITPDLAQEHAAWLYKLPGTTALRNTLWTNVDSSEHRREALADPAVAAVNEPPSDPLNDGVITVTASDTLDNLSLRFDQPTQVDRDVFDLAVRRIIVDPGHGGEHLGTSSGALAEKEITLDVGLRVRDLLEEQGMEVLMTRVDDRSVELDDRVRFANESRGDVFLSIHVNWLGDRALRGIETFHLGPNNDPEITRRVSLENRESGYSLTDMRRLLDGIYVDLRRDESRAFARHVHQEIVKTLKDQNPNLRDRGVKQAPFTVLIGTEMPAILAEVSALNNREEAQLLRTDEYRAAIARALSAGVMAYAESLRPGTVPVVPASP